MSYPASASLPEHAIRESSGEVEDQNLSLVRVQANTLPVTAPGGSSRLEHILYAYEPIARNILAHLPTTAIFQLSFTSQFLREFLKSYPLAWKTLSFRLQTPTNIPTSPSGDADLRDRTTQQYALDLALKIVVLPIATRLTNLDLCNTAVHGVTLIGDVLTKRSGTLQHLSVRGCKNVSLKYHIVPFLQSHKRELQLTGGQKTLALTSLYTYRCRHHRRRPYLPSSLVRRDSDSEPTHELIELCHFLGIWTDTSWCPTPGPRCNRRKDYHARAAGGSTDVWVPFDRLWRSGNRVGPSSDETKVDSRIVGKLWEEIECGVDGEPLGTGNGMFAGEGKDVPMHLRKSHNKFVDDIKCDDCGDAIHERCETCSIKMHCMGCRKTLCASCAFNKPYRRPKSSIALHQLGITPPVWALSRQKAKRKADRFWWAPGANRCPNVMTEAPDDSDSESESLPAPLPQGDQAPLKINMQWCCLEPLFSGGGGVAFVGTGLAGSGSDRIRAVPLPKQQQFIDADFARPEDEQVANHALQASFERFENAVTPNMDVLPYLQQATIANLQANTCPRCLCSSCYNSARWKVACGSCKTALCKEHDFRALKVRKCGYRELSTERDYVRNPPKHVGDSILMESRSQQWPRDLQIPSFRQPDSSDDQSSSTGLEDERRARTSDTEDNLEESDAGSSADGPSTRDPSSTPRATPGPSVDRSTSTLRSDAEFASRFARLTTGDKTGDSSSSPLGVRRTRSVSMSELLAPPGREKPSASPAQTLSKEEMLLPCSPGHPVQWEGCGAYFCQAQRSMGDGRVRCNAAGKDCVECGVYVCGVRIAHNPSFMDFEALCLNFQ